MLLAQPAESENMDEWQIESDLASVACLAAIELDNLILGRSREVKSVERLVSMISESIPQSASPGSADWLLDPSTVVVVSKAISDADCSEPSATVDELVKKAGKITNLLGKLVAESEGDVAANSENLERMRTFCLALSRHAAASEQVSYRNSPEHPFRS